MGKTIEFVSPLTPLTVVQSARHSLPVTSNLVKVSRRFRHRRSLRQQHSRLSSTSVQSYFSDINVSKKLTDQINKQNSSNIIDDFASQNMRKTSANSLQLGSDSKIVPYHHSLSQNDNKNSVVSNNGRRDTAMIDAWSGRFNTSNQLFNQSTKYSRKNSYRHHCSCLRILLPTILAFLILGGILTAILVSLLNTSKKTTTTTIAYTLINSVSPITTITNIHTTNVSTAASTNSGANTDTSTTSSTSSGAKTGTSTTSSTSTETTMTTTTTTQKICLSDLTLLTTTNETIYSLWNTIAGSNGALSTPGSSAGNYWPSEIPQYAFDRSSASKYTSFGSCNSSTSSFTCGINTGVYLTLQRGASLLLAIQFRAANDNLERDPLTLTIEGSNQSSSALMLGSSWSLIYNGSTGLSPDPGRYTDGAVQYIRNNAIWYTSYRLLITSKRTYSSSIQYGEITLLGY